MFSEAVDFTGSTTGVAVSKVTFFPCFFDFADFFAFSLLFFASVGGSGVASTFTVGVSTVVAVGATSGVGVNVLTLGGIGSGAVTGTAALASPVLFLRFRLVFGGDHFTITWWKCLG